MNFEELQNEVLGHRLNDTHYREPVKSWLNEGQRFVVLQADLRTQQTSETFVTAADDANLDVPDDYARLISLTNTDDANPLAPISLRDYDDASTSTGKPTGYVVVGNQIYLYPTPDAAYNLRFRYWSLPPEMVETGDTPSIPEQYHHLLVHYALVRAYQRENDYEAAQYHRAEFENELAKMKGEANYEGQDGPRQVEGMWASVAYDPNRWY